MVFNIAFEVYIMFYRLSFWPMRLQYRKMVAEPNSRGEYSKTSQNSEISTILLCVYRHCRKCRALFRLTVFCTCNERRKGDICNTNDCTVNIFVALGTAYKSYYQQCFKYDTDRTFRRNRRDC